MSERSRESEPTNAIEPETVKPEVASEEKAVNPRTGIALGPAIVQAKLTVGPANDRHEVEADAVADRVVRSIGSNQQLLPEPRAPRVRRGRAAGGTPSDDGGEHDRSKAQRTSALPTLGPALTPMRRIMRRAEPIGAEGGAVDDDTAQKISSSRSSGKPLPAQTRSTMESAFDTDFSAVRVHEGSRATELNDRIQAKAFTTGNDIFFRDGLPSTSSASGQHLLAHELTHTVQQGGGIQRLWGRGNTGRREKEETALLERAGRGPDAIATEVKGLLGKKRFTSQITRFNKVMQVLTTPKAKAIELAYDAAKGSDPSLKAAITASFTKKKFRSTYLHHVLENGGTPNLEHRILLALGLAGAAAQGMISDQEEATRLYQGLPPDEQQRIFGKHKDALKAGMSAKGFKQLLATVRSAHAQTDLAEALAPSVQQEGEVSPQGMQQKASRGVLRQSDIELGAIVARGLKAESTTAFDSVTVRMKADVSQMAGEVKSWVTRIKAIEEATFDGKPVVRDYVLGRAVSFDLSATNRLAIPARGDTTQFEKHLAERAYKYGWNPGDREYIRQLVAGGTAAMPTDNSAEVDPSAALTGKNPHLGLVQAALGRARSPEVIAAFAAIAGELTIVDQLTAKNRRQRLRDEMLAVKPAQAWEFLAALLALPIPAEGDDDLHDQQHKLYLGADLALDIFRAASLKPKHRAQFAAKLAFADKATPGYLEVRRYAFKSSFKSRKFLSRVSALSKDERVLARDDTNLRNRVRGQLTYEPEKLAAVNALIGWVDGPVESTAPTQDAQQEAEKQDWADRWAVLLAGSKDQKKFYNFAITIIDGAPVSDGNAYLHSVYSRLSGTPKKKLDATKLGKALRNHEIIGTGGFDIVKEIIGKSKTSRPTGSANVDAICGSFESMSGRRLLDEWTNFAELTNGQSALAKRKGKLEDLNQFWENADLDDDAQMAELQNLLDTVRVFNTQLVSGFMFTLREDRRKHLNSGVSQLTTKEFQTVKDRHSEHIAGSINRDEGFRDALLEAGVMPSELKAIGANVVFVADQAKQSNLDTWNQWNLFTVRGQLRNESSGLLVGGLNAVHSATAKGGDVGAAVEDFSEKRAELKSRTKAFVDTANAYKDRLKMIINMILSIIVTICTAGIGGMGALVLTAINAAIELTKQIMMGALDQLLAPGQTSFSGEMIIGTIKTLLMSGLSLGMGALTNQLKESFNLVDVNGLSKGSYLLPGQTTATTSNALKVGFGLSDSSWQGWGTNLGMKLITTGVNKAGVKVVNLVTDSIADGPNGALKKLKGSFQWSEVLELTVGVALKDFIARAQYDMLAGVKLDGVKNKEDAVDQHGTAVEAQVMNSNSMVGAVDGLDSTYTKDWTSSHSTGAKMQKSGAKVATNLTVFNPLTTLCTAPQKELDAVIASNRDAGQGSPAKADAKSIELQAVTKRFLDAYAAAGEDESSRGKYIELNAALRELMSDQYRIDALADWNAAERGIGPAAAKPEIMKWLLDVLKWVTPKVTPPPPPVPPRPAALVGAAQAPNASGGA